MVSHAQRATRLSWILHVKFPSFGFMGRLCGWIIIGAHILCTIALVLPKIWCAIRTTTKWTWGRIMGKACGQHQQQVHTCQRCIDYSTCFFVRIVIHNKHIMCMCTLHPLKDNLHIFEPIRSWFYYLTLTCGCLALLIWECKWQTFGWMTKMMAQYSGTFDEVILHFSIGSRPQDHNTSAFWLC